MSKGWECRGGSEKLFYEWPDPLYFRNYLKINLNILIILEHKNAISDEFNENYPSQVWLICKKNFKIYNLNWWKLLQVGFEVFAWIFGKGYKNWPHGNNKYLKETTVTKQSG